MKSLCVTIQIKAIEQNVPIVLFIMLQKVVLYACLESVYKTLKYRAVLIQLLFQLLDTDLLEPQVCLE